MPTAVMVVSAEELMGYLYSLYSPGGGFPPPTTGQTPAPSQPPSGSGFPPATTRQTPAPSQPPSGGETFASEPIRSGLPPTPRQLDVTKVVLWGGIALGVLILVVLLTGGD
jgi:hypothetical protein